MSRAGRLIVISGFSGAGKGTVTKKLVEDYQYSFSISATTRKPREGEVDGREYYFKTEEEFRNLVDYNGFIEWAQYVENYYGTPRAFVENELKAGHNVILEIEVQGALNIKKQYEDAILIFITTRTPDILQERLVGRGTEDMETVKKRLIRAAKEAEYMKDYDYIVVNDLVPECAAAIHSIVVGEECRTVNQETLINQMQEKLKAL